MHTMAEIETMTKRFSDSQKKLHEIISEINNKIEMIKMEYRSHLKQAAEHMKEKLTNLAAAIGESKALFISPKTQVFYGIRIGFKKTKGSISWEDKEQVIRLIKKYFPDRWDEFIITSESPSKDALANLPATDLKKLGVIIKDSGDEIFVKATDSEIEKMVAALLNDMEEKVEVDI